MNQKRLMSPTDDWHTLRSLLARRPTAWNPQRRSGIDVPTAQGLTNERNPR